MNHFSEAVESGNIEPISPALMRDILRAHANGKLEFTDDGSIRVARAGMEVGGVFSAAVAMHRLKVAALARGADAEEMAWVERAIIAQGGLRHSMRDRVLVGDTSYQHNLVPLEGRNYLLNVLARSAAQDSTWFIGAGKGSGYTPADSDAMANISSRCTELGATELVESARQAWTLNGDSSTGSLSNSSSLATITGDAGQSFTVYSLFLTGDSAFGGTSGVLLAATLLTTPKALGATDALKEGYDFSAASS